MDLQKVRQDLHFYFWVGVVLYVSACVLNIIHLYQWKGFDPVDLTFHMVLLVINAGLIYQIKVVKNWARNAFIVKFAIFLLAFYPKILFVPVGDWVYSAHWPHGIFQRVCNMSIFVYEIWFVIYLTKRSVRFVFVHQRNHESTPSS